MKINTMKMQSYIVRLGFVLLAAAGSALGAEKPAGSTATDDCLCLFADCSEMAQRVGRPNQFLRYSISQSPWTVQKGDVLEYDIFIPKDNPEKSGGVDLIAECDWLTTPSMKGHIEPKLRWCKAVDQNGIAANPAVVLKPALDEWYARKIALDGLAEMKILQVVIACEAKLAGEYVLFVDNVRVRHADGSVTAIYENGSAPYFGIRRYRFNAAMGIAGGSATIESEQGPGPYGPLFTRCGYGGYPALLSVSRAEVKAGQAAEGFLKQGREQSRRQQRALKLALEYHFLKTWIERDQSLGLDKELTDLSDRVNKLFDPGLSGEAFADDVKVLEPALASLSRTAAARAREKFPKALKNSKPQLVVDFGREVGPVTYRASGFLTGFKGDEPQDDERYPAFKQYLESLNWNWRHTWNSPPDALVAPLKPQSLRMPPFGDRSAFAAYGRARRLGGKHVSVVLSGAVMGRSKDNPLPWLWWPASEELNWSLWEGFVREMVQKALDGKYQMVWDIWNEPNFTIPGSKPNVLDDRFKEIWKRSVTIIRSLDPQAVIVGPSTSGYAGSYLKDFLLFARDEKVLPDWFCWHDYTGGEGIVKNALDIRAFMKANNIAELPICINEYVGWEDQFWPGAHVDYFAGLERVGVVSANHACWDDENIYNGANVLDGLLTHPELEPRSTWWASKGYADITGTLVGVSDGPMSALAGYDATRKSRQSGTPRRRARMSALAGYDATRKQARVLIGQPHRAGVPDAPVVVGFAGLDKAAGLVKNNKVRVTGAWIPNSETKALLRPLATLDGEYEVKDNAITVVIPNIGCDDAYTLTLGGTEEQK